MRYAGRLASLEREETSYFEWRISKHIALSESTVCRESGRRAHNVQPRGPFRGPLLVQGARTLTYKAPLLGLRITVFTPFLDTYYISIPRLVSHQHRINSIRSNIDIFLMREIIPKWPQLLCKPPHRTKTSSLPHFACGDAIKVPHGRTHTAMIVPALTSHYYMLARSAEHWYAKLEFLERQPNPICTRGHIDGCTDPAGNPRRLHTPHFSPQHFLPSRILHLTQTRPTNTNLKHPVRLQI